MKDKKQIESEIKSLVSDYFKQVSSEDLKPPQWKVSIGGGYYGEEEVSAVVECYLNGSLSKQGTVQEFEKNYAKYIGVKHGVAANSGTSANILALNALLETGGLQKGDEVALPATTFISVATPVVQLGLVPVYVDVDPETLNLDPKKLEETLAKSDKIKCVMIVHTLGCPADMTACMDIAEKHSLKVIEDCCEAHGAEWNGKKVGSFGDIATWSFYVAHNMTTAEGGMVATDNDEYAAVVRELREFGRDKEFQGERYSYNTNELKDFDERYTFRRIGWNFRMADAPGAFGNEQLKKLPEMNAIRIKNAEYLINALSHLSDHFILPPKADKTFVHSYYSFPIVIKKDSGIDRKDFAQYLEDNKVETRAIMCGTLSDQPNLVDAPGRDADDLAESRYIKDNGLFIGCHPLLSKTDLDYAVTVIEDYIKNKNT